MPRKPRDYEAEYARRIARGSARGLSRSQARGHPKIAETLIRSAGHPLEDARIQLALRTLRRERNLAKAAKAVKVSPERLRKYTIEHSLIEKAGRRWRPRADLPRRMLIIPTPNRCLSPSETYRQHLPWVASWRPLGGFWTQTTARSLRLSSANRSATSTAGNTPSKPARTSSTGCQPPVSTRSSKSIASSSDKRSYGNGW
jgi:hypothetical protein